LLREGKDGMTRIEAEATGGLVDGRGGGSRWSEFLVPIVTAVLVLALGLVLVGLTTDQGRSQPGQGSTVEGAIR